MPERLRKIQDIDITKLSPHQVRLSTVLEIGAGVGRLPDVFSPPGERCESCEKCEGCQSCQTCQGCQSCQTSIEGMVLENLVGADALSVGPMRLVRDVIYELVEASDIDQGVQETKESRVLLEASEGAYDRMLRKDLFAEVGTTKSGAKRYVLRKPLS